MHPKKSILHPLRHKRTTFVVAVLVSLACGLVMIEEESYAQIFRNISSFAISFLDLIRLQFA